MRALALLALLALLCAGCENDEVVYRCDTSDQCNVLPGGRCEVNGYCSYADAACASGRRYSDLSGPNAHICVGSVPGGDGGVDAPLAVCPADYTAMTGGTTGHVYRRSPTNLSWTGQYDFCATTSARAYLAVPSDAAELSALATLAATLPFWIGIDDRAIEGTFVQSNGGAATFLPWASGQPDNAGGGGGEDCVAATATAISDELCTGGASNRPAVCECEL